MSSNPNTISRHGPYWIDWSVKPKHTHTQEIVMSLMALHLCTGLYTFEGRPPLVRIFVILKQQTSFQKGLGKQKKNQKLQKLTLLAEKHYIYPVPLTSVFIFKVGIMAAALVQKHYIYPVPLTSCVYILSGDYGSGFSSETLQLSSPLNLCVYI